MSKAFTRESDDEEDEPLAPPPSASLPPGAKNYMTPDGAERLRAEMDRLMNQERPALVSSADDGNRKRKLQRLDRRILQLEESLRTAVVMPTPEDRSEVRFGATVTVRRRGGEVSYRIVGVDETDLDNNWVSYLSPIARALLNARLGEKVQFRFPSGEEELEIVGIEYES
jgi:transcription elongation factor GreB